jgi:hypothetical protein
MQREQHEMSSTDVLLLEDEEGALESFPWERPAPQERPETRPPASITSLAQSARSSRWITGSLAAVAALEAIWLGIALLVAPARKQSVDQPVAIMLQPAQLARTEAPTALVPSDAPVISSPLPSPIGSSAPAPSDRGRWLISTGPPGATVTR